MTQNIGRKPLISTFSEAHCHVKSMADEAIEKCKNMNVKLVLAAGIDMPSCEDAVLAAQKFDIVKGCVGIHPWYADDYSSENHEKLRVMASKPEMVAISEIGLDYGGRMTKNWERSSEVVDHNIQRATLRGQIELAKELGLPVLIHDRAHGEEILDIIEETGINKIGAAIHGHTKGPEYSKRAVKLGVYLSIGRSILRDGNEELKNAVKEIPVEYLLTETDSGDPTGVIAVSAKIAEIKGLTKESIGLRATSNLRKLLKL